jgi:hypothetical protein
MALSIPLITEYNGKGLDRFRKELAQAETVTQKAGLVLKKAFIPATAALGALAVAAKDVIGVASDLGESTAKVGVIFGDGATAVEDFARQAAKSMGQSRRSVLQAAGTFGTFGKAAGLTGKELATFANDFTALASDLASFNNTTPEDAIQAIGAALRGEAEPMRRYGVLLNDATLKQAALELGIYDGVGALDAQQKILAAQKVIYEQTSDAQGDFQRTSEGLANSQRTLSAQLDNTKAAIGEALLPVVEAVLPLLQTFATWASENPTVFLTIAGAIGAVAAAIVAVNFAMALNPFTAIAAGIAALVVGVVAAYHRFEGFRNIVNSVFNGLKTGVRLAIDNFTMLLNVWKNVFNGLARLWNNSLGKLSISIPDIPGLPGRGKSFGIPNIPYLAEGGIVTRPSLAMIAEAGEPEAVIPLSKLSGMLGGGGGGVTINVQGADPNAVVDALRTYMFRNGSVPIKTSSL